MEIPRFHLTRSTVALSIKVIAVLGVTTAIYFQDVTVIANEALQSELMSHVLAIPFLFAYLLYRKRKMLRATISLETSPPIKRRVPFHEVIGPLFCIVALLLYWYGSSTFRPLGYHIASLPLFISGALLIIFNIETLRALVFPITFLLFLSPPPLEIVYIAGATVATLSSEVSYVILKTIGLPIRQITGYGAPALVVTNPSGSSISFVIAAASSGIYSLIGFSIFVTFLTYVARGPAWKKVTLFFASLPLIYALNIMRIIILVLIGYWQGVEAAWNAFHLFGGWILIFLGSLILLFIAERIWKIRIFTTKPKAVPCLHSSQSMGKNQNFCFDCGKLLRYVNINISKRDLYRIVILLIGTSLILTLQVPIFASMRKPSEILPKEVAGYTLKFIQRAPENHSELANLEELLYYIYLPQNSSKERLQVLVNIGIGKSWSVFHPWEVSLISWREKRGLPSLVTQIHDDSITPRKVRLLDNPPIAGLFSAFRSPNSTLILVVLELGPIDLKETRISNSTSSSEQKYTKITLYTQTNDPDHFYEIEDVLLLFGEATVNHWQPTKPWSLIALALSQNGMTLLTITTVLLAMVSGTAFLEKLSEEKSNLKTFRRLVSKQEKNVILAVHQGNHTVKPTTSKIASYYQKIAGKSIEIQHLLRKLEEAEKAGLVEKDIVSLEDEPILTWKSRIRFHKVIL